jgi:zinc transporter ZupT
MLSLTLWAYLVGILVVTLAGGLFPLIKRDQARGATGFPRGEAFMAGVFFALSLMLMLPSSFHLMAAIYPDLEFPIGSLLVAGIFLALLGLEHLTKKQGLDEADADDPYSSPAIPIIMTIMIAVPSFFLGTALSVSSPDTAFLIFIAIMIHKSSAAFALTLKMVRSTLSNWQSWALFAAFVVATPLGIIAGAELSEFFGRDTITVIKSLVLALAGGTFMYMAILHEHRHTAMIRQCGHVYGYSIMTAGFLMTALVRLLIGEAHHLG